MVNDKEIPCTTCSLWKKQRKEFSCKPNRCEVLSEWLLKTEDPITFEVRIRENQYIV
ncbi:hypothetical protein JJE00_02805 [Candidatus Bathyarchaeota archaeon]|nr:hypothetical protein [Candidatus Bathyarchaeota archaeon]